MPGGTASTKRANNHHKLFLVISAALLMGAGVPSGAHAADFSPSADYHLCTEDSEAECVHEKGVDAATQFRVELGQDAGEEELENITLEFSPGFRFPSDDQIEGGERLADAHISIHAGPCAAGAGTVPLEIDGFFEERDRTEQEIKDGVRVVFRLNLDPIPPLDIKVSGNERTGHSAVAIIEDRAATCPPFSFEANFFGRSEDSGVPLLMSPRKPGKYSLRAIFTGTQGSVYEYSYPYKFTR